MKQHIAFSLMLLSVLTLSACQTTSEQHSITRADTTDTTHTDDTIITTGSNQTASPTTITIDKSQTNNNENTSNDLVYRNEEYGFEITFPPEREGYTVYTHTEGIGKVGTSFEFTLPTTSPYRSIEDPTTGEKIPNTASIFAISIMDESQYKEATKYGGPGTPGLLGSKDSIYYAIVGGNDLPDDIQNKIHWFSSPNTLGEQSSRSINKAFKIL